MYPTVTAVRPNEDFSLSIVFDDGAEGILDMKPYLDFGVFRRINTPDAFGRVRVAFDTVEWECGLDLDPEFVRDRAHIRNPA